ncbi:hypothetical protein IV487_10635 [Enterococcus saccharolyticus]|uniref:hypothetical protein n=1 Tax=Enterococcus TaxID=1350 RepID=UPI001E40964D|nr:hypothetical protein [Enterococcus saccharolyticus]MCD5002918.1 hypothetical protein [Enterococcus saccharolyticus]
MEDKEFQKILKKSRYRQTRKILITLICILLPFVIGSLAYMYIYNYNPLEEEKVPGVKNNQIVSTEEDLGAAVLLFDYLGQVKLNAEANKMTFYVDYYEKDKLISHSEYFSAEAEEEGMMSGKFIFGIPTNDNHLLASFMTNDGKLGAQKELENYNPHNEGIFWSSKNEIYANQNIIKNQKMYLFYLGQTNRIYSEIEENIKPENLKNVDQSFVLYLIFE